MTLARAIVDELPRATRQPRRAFDARVLAVVLLVDERPRTVGEIRHVLNVPQATASGFVDLAVAAGLVERHVDASDARRAIVVLTAAGQRWRRRRRGGAPS